jgi:hypothetical protein
MAKGKKTKKKPKKAKRVESKLKEATPDADEAEDSEEPVAAEPAVSAAKSEAKPAPAPKPKPEANKPAPAVDRPLTREERRAKRKAVAAGETGGAIEAVEDAGSGGALIFLGVIFSLLIVAIIVALISK